MLSIFLSGTGTAPVTGLHVGGIPIEFFIFALTLFSVAVFHHHTLKSAISGLIVIVVYKVLVQDFSLTDHFIGTDAHPGEWNILLNLFGLLTGFSLLADHFERSRIPDLLPRHLPQSWRGGFVLLVFVFILSSFLDNIAAAMIGGTMAHVVFKGKVHIAYLAGIVAASNAGGAGSVLGDTTTTMMWIDGINAIDVLPAFIASVVAFMTFGVYSAWRQQRWCPVSGDTRADTNIDWSRMIVVVLILAGAIATNIMFDFPAAGVWLAIVAGCLLRTPNWRLLPSAIQGSVFLLSLVASASMMPVDELPIASWKTTFMLGFVSSVFDNIPLTKLALDQMGYDWGLLAYAVGFGGSMVWFGSSAGVALSNMYPQVRSVKAWVINGWPIMVGYILGFFAQLLACGWHPHAPHK